MQLYIDPGTGSMLFTVIIGLATTGVFLGKGLWMKLKQKIGGGKIEVNVDKIPLVIFSDHKRYWNVFGPICDELEKRKIACEFWTMSPDDPALEMPYEFVKCQFIGEGNKAFAKLNMMNARICLATTPQLDVLQWKRSKNTDFYIHIFHALDDGTLYRMFALDHYDAVLMSGAYQEAPARALEEKRHTQQKELVITGITYMDELYRRLDELKSQCEQTNSDVKTILCAPTWGENGLLNKYGEAFIDALIETGYNIVIRPHPQSFTAEADLMEKLQKKYPESEYFHWNRDNDNFKVLSEADMMISDFSGVIFDYALVFDRPVIYTDVKLDTAPYDAAWLDDAPWLIGFLETLGRKLSADDFPDMKAIIDEVLADDRYVEGRNNARKTVWANQGEAAVKTVDYLTEKLQLLSSVAQEDEIEKNKE